MLDTLEAEIGHKEESLQYDGSSLTGYWSEALQIYGAEDFLNNVLKMFPDFHIMDMESLPLITKLLEQGVTFNRKNLSRIFGITHGTGTVKNALNMLEAGIPFDSGHEENLYFAYAEDIYRYLCKFISDDDALQITLRLCMEGREPECNDMNFLVEHGVPLPMIRMLWQLEHLQSSVHCYAHAGEFLRLAWYYENYYDDYIRLFCS